MFDTTTLSAQANALALLEQQLMSAGPAGKNKRRTLRRQRQRILSHIEQQRAPISVNEVQSGL